MLGFRLHTIVFSAMEAGLILMGIENLPDTTYDPKAEVWRVAGVRLLFDDRVRPTSALFRLDSNYEKEEDADTRRL